MYAWSLVIVIDDLASLFQDDQHLHKHRHTQTYEDAIEIGGIKNRKKPRKLVVVGRKNYSGTAVLNQSGHLRAPTIFMIRIAQAVAVRYKIQGASASVKRRSCEPQVDGKDGEVHGGRARVTVSRPTS